jgi:hypothetical protein
MPRGDWRKTTGYWILGTLALAVLVFLGVVVWTVRDSTSKNWNDYQQNATEIQAEAKRYVEERCIGLDGRAFEHCERDANQAAHNKERTEADLYAQRQMAEWAFVVGISGLISIPLTLAGIFFVWRSLNEMALQRQISRDALQAAADSNLIQQRHSDTEFGPKFKIIRCETTLTEKRILMALEVKNIGKTSAINAEFGVHGRFWDFGKDDSSHSLIFGTKMTADSVFREIPAGETETLYCNCTFDDEKIHRVIWSNPDTFDCNGIFTWESRFGQTHRWVLRLEPHSFRKKTHGGELMKVGRTAVDVRSQGQEDNQREDQVEE